MLFFSLFIFVCSYYYQPNDVGGYSLGVGGAPIGLNSSVECGLYNPAAFAIVEKLNIFGSYKLTKGGMSSVPMPVYNYRLDYAFPDYLGVALPIGDDFFLGLSLSVPYLSASKNDMVSLAAVDPFFLRFIPGEYVQSERFYFLNTTIGKAINDKFSVGLNMGAFWKCSRESFEPDDPESNPEYVGLSITTDKYGIEPCLGLQYKASDILSFGVLVKKGFGEAYRYLPLFSDTSYSIERDEGLPLVLGFGTGINLKDKICLNVSAEYMHWTLAYSEGERSADDYRNIIRLHFGGQYRFNELLSFSAGFYTTPSPIKLGIVFDPGSYDQIFLTGGVGLDFGRVSLNLSAASSALIKMDPALREENHFNLSVVYR